MPLIKFDKNTDIMRPAVRGMQQIRDGLEELQHWQKMVVQSRNGQNGSSATHYNTLATEGSFQTSDGLATAAEAAKASFDEIDSLLTKIASDAATSAVFTAIVQAPAKHGV